MRIKRLLTSLCAFAAVFALSGTGAAYAQNDVRQVQGQVLDENSEPIVAATIIVKGTTAGVTTDVKGKFALYCKPSDVLVFSYLGYDPMEVTVGNQSVIDVKLSPAAQAIEDVVVTAWGTEKKTTMIGSVATVRPKELKGPTSNVTAMLAGRVAGLVSYQLSGEPGADNAEFFVRGVGSFGTGRSSPLILINGIESSSTELANIQPDDIEGFSVLKDATATSMYGSRGANGVILVTTKSGHKGKTKFNIRYEASFSGNTRDYNLADNVTFMELVNEATLTRNPTGMRPYSIKKIENTRMGADPLIYPNNDWKEIMLRDFTTNHRVNLNASGGAEIARYYISASYKVDNGVLKTHSANDFNTNIKNSSIEIRSNVDLNLTKTTVASVRVSGQFDELNGPSVGSGSDIFRSLLNANPVEFPAVYPSSMLPHVHHPLFGNVSSGADEGVKYVNPFANALSGYRETATTAITAQLELHQDFSFITEGLKARLMAYTKRNTSSSMSRSVAPYYYSASLDPDKIDAIMGVFPLNPTTGREYLNYSSGTNEVWNENSMEVSLAYDRTFNDVHSISGTLLGYVRQKKLSNASGSSATQQLERSLPQRNVSFSGRFTYGYDNRYMAEFNFGYNASERFDRKHRWGFFPSVGLAWNVANEQFMKSADDVIDKLKVRYSFGLVGNDELTDWFYNKEERFFYIDMVNMNAGSIYFGDQFNNQYSTISRQRYANADIGWEISHKTNLALELGMWNSLNMEFDYFWDNRKDILMVRSDIPASMGIQSSDPIRANLGEMKSHGFEVSLDFNKNFTRDLWLSLRGTFTYATNVASVYEEPAYPDEVNYLSRVGYPWNTTWGFIAERLFIDENDVANSPTQFGEYGAGDIKYRDVNGDGEINDYDRVPMGYPTTPEVVYGFGFSFGWKDFDISAFFQGQGRTSFMIDASSVSPFVDNRGLLDVIAKDHWSEDNRNPYAFWPRLSVSHVENNEKGSSWWLRNGSFLRLKTVEIGYEPKGAWVRKLGVRSLRVYANGMNLFTFSKFKTWDVEMKGNGLGYPLQRVFNIGVQVGF